MNKTDENLGKLFDNSLLSQSPRQDYFLIRDPFNNTYNPAKNFKISEDKHRLEIFFKQAYESLRGGYGFEFLDEWLIVTLVSQAGQVKEWVVLLVF